MAQEFTIKSPDIEDKINQLLPSQGGFQPGVDFSASTMVVPIVDLTETAEGSGLRQDLQKALSLSTATTFNVNNTTSTIVNTTGYWQISGVSTTSLTAGAQNIDVKITDGISTKIVWSHSVSASNGSTSVDFNNFIIKLNAGESLQITCSGTAIAKGSVRQIADLAENLINP